MVIAMPIPRNAQAGRGSRVTTLPGKAMNPDDRLSIYNFIRKYQIQFTKHFGPKYAYGVVDSEWSQRGDEGDRIIATARVRPAHQSTRGRTCRFNVPYGKFTIWRKNLRLYEFIS